MMEENKKCADLSADGKLVFNIVEIFIAAESKYIFNMHDRNKRPAAT
jgi:hypothetical protein